MSRRSSFVALLCLGLGAALLSAGYAPAVVFAGHPHLLGCGPVSHHYYRAPCFGVLAGGWGGYCRPVCRPIFRPICRPIVAARCWSWPRAVGYYCPPVDCYRPRCTTISWSSCYTNVGVPYYGVSAGDVWANQYDDAFAVNRPAGGLLASGVDIQPIVAQVGRLLAARAERVERAEHSRLVTLKPESSLRRAPPTDSRSVADQYVEAGDRLFAQRRYHEAVDQYRRATSFASDSAHVYFRQGFALIATSRFEQATTAFRHGLAADSEYVDSRFRLEHIYAGGAAEKAAHLDALADAALRQPDASGLLFSLGVMLHFDDQSERAQKFFARAAHLSPVDERYARTFQRMPVGSPDPTPVVERLAESTPTIGRDL